MIPSLDGPRRVHISDVSRIQREAIAVGHIAMAPYVGRERIARFASAYADAMRAGLARIGLDPLCRPISVGLIVVVACRGIH